MAVTDNNYVHAQWSSRWAFILAATGSAVGLGNVWKFPYMAGQGGGGAFVLVYLLCVALIGVPIMMAEVLLGRRGRRSPINTMRALARIEGASRRWVALGWMGVLAGFLILSFYSVIAGWTLAYVFRAASGAFSGVPADDIRAMFGQFVTDPTVLLLWHSVFMIMTVAVVGRGVEAGLEKAVKVLMPALFCLLILLVVYSIGNAEFARAVEFLFRADFSRLSGGDILGAMGQAFFSLSLGMGAIMIYGSYLPQDASIAGTTFTIAIADTLVALMAGLAIFPIVFANGLEPAAGPSLIFQTLPIAFGQMTWGAFWGTLFFVLLVFAAWTSAISLIEPVVAWLTETRGMHRMASSLLVGVIIWALGIVTVMSFSDWAFEFTFFGAQKSNGLFDMLDILTSNFMLPLGGILIAIFAGWVMHRASTEDELAIVWRPGYALWRFLVRLVAPISVGVVLFFLIFGNYLSAGG
ncbi:MAG: sodium-dependent transporter [Gammaproteobacteria bacterium]|nr:sodium-dependent transporter [Gammaproteobacteria bacterium]